MTIHELSPTQAWTAGAPMWIAPAPAHSLWSRKLDWYLNFRISKGLTHKPTQRSAQLETILSKIEWKLPQSMEIEDKPLLIATGLWLPCDWLLILDELTHEKTKVSGHLEKIAQVWSDLGEPKLRVFGPSQMTKDSLGPSWAKHELPKEFEFVVE